eukprot:1195472-Prorocentrum_minimum.AAC.2
MVSMPDADAAAHANDDAHAHAYAYDYDAHDYDAVQIKTMEYLTAKMDVRDEKAIMEEGLDGIWEIASHKENRKDIMKKVRGINHLRHKENRKDIMKK